MNPNFTFSVEKFIFNEEYQPSEKTRLTTNFANLARGAKRQENLRRTLQMMNNRFNSLAHWDNANGDRYAVELEIISADMQINGEPLINDLPLIEILKTNIWDKKKGVRLEGSGGNSFSSYVRDYDFSVVLKNHNANRTDYSEPQGFGELHGKLFQHFLQSDAYKANFNNQPLICLSVAAGKTYYRTGIEHHVLGIEYTQDTPSITDNYFKKMGMEVRYFMPKNSVAPLAFYFIGDLLNDYENLELIAAISVMETFQKIYRPEIYNANAPAATQFKPSLNNTDYSLTQIYYDRVERNSLAIKQGQMTEAWFIKPYQKVLEQWSASFGTGPVNPACAA
ncbi:MAG: putative oxygenase MesX [Comamonas sp.]